MSLGEILSLFAAVVGVALVAVLVGTPNTANIVTSFGNAFQSSLSTAMGGTGKR